ncbi:Radical SAM domain protein [Pyrolobus fumarii 1A]|uniref:Radical SAM domain protein n=1 Tax=Pyrolobus fumarii (strain DSM 11204 / 1A) TaxID=694429 RepID=G0EEV7_PYRF1|nr:radical SAM protein [Pyrolobus fumarii]AEM38071.1 Radical SAM domain protein [Pyrolobus fumarii 1A]
MSESVAREVIERSLNGEHISAKLVEELLSTEPLHELLYQADKLREKIVGQNATYVVNLYVAYTNRCVAHCPICNFHAQDASRSYILPIDKIVEIVKRFRIEKGITEVHVTGGFNPDISVDYYLNLVKEIKRQVPGVTVKAFTAEELVFISRRLGEPLDQLLWELKEAGLDALPGGGAEILDENIRRIITPYKSDPTTYLEVHKMAHRIGIRSNVTMLYGHIEEPKHIAIHLLSVLRIQRETAGFISFIPIRWRPGNTALAKNPKYKEVIAAKQSPLYDLRIIAVSRLVLGRELRNITAYWVALGKRLASIALRAGANDLGGTFYNEPVIGSTEGKITRGLDPTELEYIIVQAGLVPCERNTFYECLGRRAKGAKFWRETLWLAWSPGYTFYNPTHT